MKEIINKPQNHLNRKPYKGQSNWVHRQLKLQHISRENKALLERLRRTKSRFNIERWEKEREHMEFVIRGMSRYDETGQIKGLQAARQRARTFYQKKYGGSTEEGGEDSTATGGGGSRPSTAGAGTGRRRGGKGKGRRSIKTAHGQRSTAGAGGAGAAAGDEFSRTAPLPSMVGEEVSEPPAHGAAPMTPRRLAALDADSVETPIQRIETATGPQFRTGRRLGSRFCIVTAQETEDGVRVTAYDQAASETFSLDVPALGSAKDGTRLTTDDETMVSIMHTMCDRVMIDERPKGGGPPQLVIVPVE